MLASARAHEAIWTSYNLPYDTSKDPEWAPIERHWRKEMARQ